jgi:hypothetical protein
LTLSFDYEVLYENSRVSSGQDLKAIVLESFLIQGRGILVELQYFQNGLKEGTMLHSKQSGNRWEVKSRVLFDHVAGVQKEFPDEHKSFMRLKFSSIEKREKSKKNILEKEASGIFQYHLSPHLSQNEKPEKGETLLIEFPPND